MFPLPRGAKYLNSPLPPAGFEPTIPAVERPQTYAVDRALTAISSLFYTFSKSFTLCKPPFGSGSSSRANVEGTLILRFFRYALSLVHPTGTDSLRATELPEM